MVQSRRRLLALGGTGLAGGLAGCLGRLRDDGGSTGERTALSTIETEGSISDITYYYGLDAGVWADHGIDLSFEVAAFGKYNRQIVTGSSEIGAPSTVAQLKFVDKGEELALVGQQLNMFNRMFVRADEESIEDPSDLAGTRVGLPASKTSTTSTTHRVLVEDEYGIDLLEDPAETRTAPPAALWEFLQQGELDAISEFSGHTIKGIADDSVRTIFDPYELWRGRTGRELPTTTYTVRRDWLADNADTVVRFLRGWQDAMALFAEETDAAIEEYGDVAGITSGAEAEVVKELVDDGIVYGPAFFDAEGVEANWEFVDLLADAGVLSARPDRDRLFATESELTSTEG
jgi:ABC-type nitrate/sulfonate/bicarbonate transport system substrate-binding protein